MQGREVYEALSGERLKLQFYLYEDGTRQLDTEAFYDARLHTRCTPQPWLGGVTRCVPDAGDTVYTDPTCTDELGRARTGDPSYFISHERLADKLVPVRLHRGPRTVEAPAAMFELRDGACVPADAQPDSTYYALSGPIDWADVVEVGSTDVGDARIGLRVLTAADGLRAPIVFRDRDLDIECRPEDGPDGATCAPLLAVPAAYFEDARCEEPVVVIAQDAEVPVIASVLGLDGCKRYFGIAGEISVARARYRLDRGACVRATIFLGERSFALGAPLELASIGRTLEEAPTRRLQQFLVEAGELWTRDHALFDSAIRAACTRHKFGRVSRCLPADAVAAVSRFTSARCSVEVRIAELPRTSCERSAFAIASTEDTVDVHAIGAPHDGALYTRDAAGGCQLHAGSPLLAPHAVGPPIPLDSFLGAVVIGDR